MQPVEFKRLLLRSSEGRILVVGIALTLIYILAMLLVSVTVEQTYRSLMAINGANILFGRAAGLSVGFASGLDARLVVFINMVIETLMVLIVYPLFIMSWRQLLNLEALKRVMDRFEVAARRHKPLIQKYGPAGLFLFVWFPFWMTGPTVGCVVGYLIGLRHRTTLAVVLGGTYVAISVWALLLYWMQDWVEGFNPNLTWLLAVFVLCAVVTVQLFRWLRRP